MAGSDSRIAQDFVAFRYDELNCWADLTRLAFDSADHALLDRLLENGVIELDDKFIHECPPGIRRELKTVWPRLTHLKSGPERSYFPHDCRELSMMLAGEKPFASFHVGPGEALEDVLWRPQPWDRFVEEGRIIRYETAFGRDADEYGRAILFALPDEVWRCKAYEMLYANSLEYGFMPANDPMFGRLWGYTDAQNREHLALMRRLPDDN